MGFGTSSLGQLGDLLGLNGNDASAKAIEALKQSPIYQSLFANGQEAVLQNASATGGIRGGNTQGALADFGRDTLAQTIQQQIANLFGGVGVGQRSALATDTLGQEGANNIESGYTSIGNSNFNKILGKQQVYNDLGSQIQKIFASIPTGGF